MTNQEGLVDASATAVHQIAAWFAHRLSSTLVLRNEGTIKVIATVADTEESFPTASPPCLVSEQVFSLSASGLNQTSSNTSTSEVKPKQIVKFSCPSLSLQHAIQSCGGTTTTSQKEKEAHCSDNDYSNRTVRPSSSNDKNDVGKHAEILLKRPIECCIDVSQVQPKNDGCIHPVDKGLLLALISTKTSTSSDPYVLPPCVLSELLVQNLYSSFSILLDSRFQAYSVFLTRQAFTVLSKQSHFESDEIASKLYLDKIMKTLDAVITVGNLLIVRSVKSKFILKGTTATGEDEVNMGLPSPSSTSVQSALMKNESEIGLVLLVTFECYVPLSSASSFLQGKAMVVNLTAPGSIKASMKKDNLDSVELVVDTKVLLANMIQAVSAVVQTALQFATVSGSACFQSSLSSSQSISCANGVGSCTTSVGQEEDVPTTVDEEERSRCIQDVNKDQLRKINRSASYIEMPPPLPVRKGSKKCFQDSNHGTSLCEIQKHLSTDEFSLGLNLLSRTAFHQVHAVSPEVTNSVTVPVPSHFDLSSTSSVNDLATNESEEESYDIGLQQHQSDFVSNLSPDDCASIIDVCLSNVSCFGIMSDDDDDDVVQGTRCSKRIKLC